MGNHKNYWIFEEKIKCGVSSPNQCTYSYSASHQNILLTCDFSNRLSEETHKNGVILTSGTEILAWTTSATS